MRPPLGAWVTLTAHLDQGEHWLGDEGASTRVEDDDGGAVAVAAPWGPGDIDPPAPGDLFHLRWTGPRGVHEMPAQLRRATPGSDAPGASRVALWWFEPVGAVQVDQRREFVRAPKAEGWPAHVQLTWFLPEEGSAEGFLCDLSEGGLRAELGGWPGGEGVPVVVRLTMAESAGDGVEVQEHELFATALRGTPSASGATTDVSVRFHEPVPRADELRSLVFAWQRAMRREGYSAER